MDVEDIIELLPLLLKGEATQEQKKELISWLEEDEEHQRIWRDLCRLYFQLHYARQWEKIDWREAKKRGCGVKKNDRFWVGWRLWFSGVAALCLISLSLLFILRHTEHITPVPEKAELIRTGEKRAVLTLANGQKVELDSKKVVMDLGHVTAEGDSLSGLTYRPAKDTSGVEPQYNTLSVPRGGEYILTLSDGTKVWLNSETEMTYPVVFATGKREVAIVGEAFFEVKKHDGQPFIVSTPNTCTTVLGTAFNVMAYKGEDQTEITLVKGAVAVSAGGKDCRIEPGQQVSVDNVSLQMEKHEVNVAFFISWKEGLFDFDHMKLTELCEKLGRWYDVDFHFVNPQLAEKRFTGAVKRNNSLQFMLDFVEKTSGVHFEIIGKTIRVHD